MDSRIASHRWGGSVVAGISVAAVTAAAVAAPAFGLFGHSDSAAAETVTAAALTSASAASTAGDALSAKKPTWLQQYVVKGQQRPNGPVETIKIKMWYAADGTYLQHNGGDVDFEGVAPQYTLGTNNWLTFKQVRALPSDIDELRSVINRGLYTGGLPESVLGQLTQLIAGPVTPEVRSGLLTILAEYKGVSTRKSAKDSLGRAGVAYEERVGSMVSRVVFAPDASLLEASTLQSGKVIESATYTSIGASARPKVSPEPPVVPKPKK